VLTAEAEFLSNRIESLLLNQSLKPVAVTRRTKDIASAIEKAKRKSYLRPIEQTTDLVGVRVIMLDEGQMRQAARLIESNLVINKENSINKVRPRSPVEFGYRSLHLIVENFCGLPICAEIQIRSVLQHAWAEIEHAIQYKRGLTLHPSLRREIAKISAILELADEHIEKISAETVSYDPISRELIDEVLHNLPNAITKMLSLKDEGDATKAIDLLYRFGVRSPEDFFEIMEKCDTDRLNWLCSRWINTKYPPNRERVVFWVLAMSDLERAKVSMPNKADYFSQWAPPYVAYDMQIITRGEDYRSSGPSAAKVPKKYRLTQKWRPLSSRRME
jgi:ppGpp synthetase/RelA/SpoT-type nucleotidyltranferase